MMKTALIPIVLAVSLAGAASLSGCTQMPTEKQGISDMRPQISFRADHDRVKSAGVLVDGLDMGAVGNYLEGLAAMRIQPGTHVITVVLGNQVLLEEKFYAGDGVNRTFILK